MKPEAAVDLLEAEPLGKALWIRGGGSCMAPLIWNGDSLRVRRCSEGELAPGDVALMRASDGRPYAHMVVAVRPLRTATFRGAEDSPNGARLVGRVEAFRRAGVVIPLPPKSRRLIQALQRLTAGGQRALSAARNRIHHGAPPKPKGRNSPCRKGR